MPELPDVETAVRTLRRKLVGRRVAKVELLAPSTVRSPSADHFRRKLAGRTVQKVRRMGKYLLLGLDGDLTLVIHFRMTGDFEIASESEPRHPHTRVVFTLDGTATNSDELRFVDQRRFGHMDLVTGDRPDAMPELWRLGLEPLARGFTAEAFRDLLKGRRGALKPLLLRQELIAGIGNIYADEILFQARLHPTRSVESLRPAEVRRLYHSIRDVLRRATVALSRYRRPVGDLLEARAPGERCPRCGEEITFMRVGGRGTYYCPRCQRPKGGSRAARA